MGAGTRRIPRVPETGYSQNSASTRSSAMTSIRLRLAHSQIFPQLAESLRGKFPLGHSMDSEYFGEIMHAHLFFPSRPPTSSVINY